MQLLWLPYLLLLVSHARAQLPECDEIQTSDLGSTVTAGTDGAIAFLFGGGQVGDFPNVLVTSSRTVCLSAATTRDKYYFASVIVTYQCEGILSVLCPSGSNPRTDQFEFECLDDGSGPSWSDSTLLTNDRNDPVDPSITTLRRNCSLCISPADAATIVPAEIPVDPETHCAACNAACLGDDVSLGLCTDSSDTGCCNYYENDICEIQCSGVLEPDTSFDCVEMCDPLTNPVNGQVTFTTRTVGSVATYNCEEGYNIIGSTTRTCQMDNGELEWSDSEPTCQIVDCGALIPPPNAQVSVTGTEFGSTATYSCNGNRVPAEGNSSRMCQADGTWSGTPPRCVEACEILSNPANGQVTSSERSVGSVATYSCNTGFELVGNEARTCESGSVWSGTEPSCEVVDCGSLPSPANGQVTQISTILGSVANYSCSGRRSLVGVDQRTCLESGEWSDSPPTCNCSLDCQNRGEGNEPCTECICAVGYSGATCGNCALENCFGCTEVPAVCVACDTGYVVNTVGVCECTLENCMTCQGVPPTCMQCEDGYTINAENNALCECSRENCLECDGSPPSCVRCSPGFTLIGGGCVFIERPCDVDFCQRCGLDDLNFCEQCETGYLNRQGTCIITEDDGLNTAEIIGIAIGCIIGAILLLTISACIVASIYRYKYPLVMHKKKRRPPPQLFVDGFGNVIANPLAGHRHATNMLYEEDLLELELEEGVEAEDAAEGEEEGWEDEEDQEGEEASDSDEVSLSKIDEGSEYAEDIL